jgi:hypothetical protein
MGIKNPSFHTDFKKAFVKSATKKSFAQKTDYFSTYKNFQLVKQFFG